MRAPVISRQALEAMAAGCDRDALLLTLQSIDPNGSYTDSASAADDLPPMTLSEARETLRRFAAELPAVC